MPDVCSSGEGIPQPDRCGSEGALVGGGVGPWDLQEGVVAQHRPRALLRPPPGGPPGSPGAARAGPVLCVAPSGRRLSCGAPSSPTLEVLCQSVVSTAAAVAMVAGMVSAGSLLG